MSFVRDLYAAEKAHRHDAAESERLFKSYCDEGRAPRIPGMDTALRLAYRISLGRTVEESAAHEYLYRWRLALRGWVNQEGRGRLASDAVFPAPHAIGL